MDQVAVCLMTCDRSEYTERTVESFLEHNSDRSRFVLLHGDDGSGTSENERLANSAGFQTVVRNQIRCGTLAMRFAMIEAANHFAPWVLVLENDLESVRAFPWLFFDWMARLKNVYCLRLFGEFKDAAGKEPCKTVDQWRGNRPVKWYSLPNELEPAQIGRIHWSAQPSVTRVKSLLAFHRKGNRDLGLTVRVRSNVLVHIGKVRTREGVA